MISNRLTLFLLPTLIRQRGYPTTHLLSPSSKYHEFRSITTTARFANNKENQENSTPKEKKTYPKPKQKTKHKKLQRVDRILSNRGYGTRSEVTKLCKTPSRVHVVIGDEQRRIRGASERIPSDAVLLIDGRELKPLPPLLAYHKPKEVLSAMRDDSRSHLGTVLPEEYTKSGEPLLHPVGRLDYDTSGLILFSSSGGLTHRLLHPGHAVEKEYVARVSGPVGDVDGLRGSLEEGVETAEGVHVGDLVNVTEEGGESDIRLVVREGKHRMVRRMLANLGYPVLELRRERYGAIELGDLQLGTLRELNVQEMDWAKKLFSK